MTLEEAIYEVVYHYCLELERTSRYSADGQQLAVILTNMLKETEKVRSALDELKRSRLSEYSRSDFREAIEAAVGSYLRVLEERGTCRDADGITEQLANAILGDPEVQRFLAGGRRGQRGA